MSENIDKMLTRFHPECTLVFTAHLKLKLNVLCTHVFDLSINLFHLSTNFTFLSWPDQ